MLFGFQLFASLRNLIADLKPRVEHNWLVLVRELLQLRVKLLGRHELLKEETHEPLLQTNLDRALLVDLFEVRVSFIVCVELICPRDILEAAVREDQVLSRREVIVRPVLYDLNI